jgi:hypothetical protein
MMNQETFMKQRVVKAKEQVKKQTNESLIYYAIFEVYTLNLILQDFCLRRSKSSKLRRVGKFQIKLIYLCTS